jgi:hypothetical protein
MMIKYITNETSLPFERNQGFSGATSTLFNSFLATNPIALRSASWSRSDGRMPNEEPEYREGVVAVDSALGRIETDGKLRMDEIRVATVDDPLWGSAPGASVCIELDATPSAARTESGRLEAAVPIFAPEGGAALALLLLLIALLCIVYPSL